MRYFLVVVLLAVSLFAKDKTAIDQAQAACGPRNVKFDVQNNKSQVVQAPADSAKATLYVVQVASICLGCSMISKVGLDGNWAGASKGDGYLAMQVDPGEHHLCIKPQLTFGRYSSWAALDTFVAESGKVYYFRARNIFTKDNYVFDLSPVNADEGKLLVASSALSSAHRKGVAPGPGK